MACVAAPSPMGELAARHGFFAHAALARADAVRLGGPHGRADLPDGPHGVLILARAYRLYGGFPEGCGAMDAFYPASQAAWRSAHGLCAELTARGYEARVARDIDLKATACAAGMGEIAASRLLFIAGHGPLTALQAIETDAPLERAAPRGYAECAACAGCRRCEAACPTGALRDGRLDGGRCLRRHMHAGEPVPEAYRPLMRGRLLGCEICRRACPLCPGDGEAPDGELAAAARLDALLDAGAGRALMPFWGRRIGANYARPARWLAQAILCAGRDASYARAIARHADHPDAAVRAHARWALPGGGP